MPRNPIITTEDKPETYRAGASKSIRPPSRSSGKEPSMTEKKTPRPPSKIEKEAEVEAIVDSITQGLNKLADLTKNTQKKASMKEQDRKVVGESSKAMPRGPQK